jgi:Zn-dependent peptidase ImmA (M78 family)
VTRPDDSVLDPAQLANVQRHADGLLRAASAHRRFPTPIDDLMDAAKLVIVSDEVLDDSFIQRFVRKAKAGAKAGVATIKSALSKVLGLFEANERLVVIDKFAPKPKVPFIKLHEAGHGTMPHQSKLYALMHDCEQTLHPDITDLFEREANVFASEVLFQGEVFSEEAHGQSFNIKVPMDLARKFGASHYSTFRRYVTTNSLACCLAVLEPGELDEEGRSFNRVRRVVASKSFDAIYDSLSLTAEVKGDHPLASALPFARKRMSADREVILIDRNGDERICVAAAFDTKHHVLVLVRDVARRTRSGIVVPSLGWTSSSS